MNAIPPSLTSFLERAEYVLERLEPLLPPASPVPDWSAAVAFRWRRRGTTRYLQPLPRLAEIRLSDLRDIDGVEAAEEAARAWAVAMGCVSGRAAGPSKA